MTGLSQVRGSMAVSPLFATVRRRDPERHSSALPVLTSSGNLLAGATTRVAVGFALNPFSVLKARYEVRKYLSSARSPSCALFYDARLSLERPPYVQFPDVCRAVHSTRRTFRALSGLPGFVFARRTLRGSVPGGLRSYKA